MEKKLKMYIKEGGIPFFKANMVSYPKEGGTLTYIEGFPFPRKAQANVTGVIYSLDLLKRLLKLSLQFIGKNPLYLSIVLIKWKKLLSNFNNLGEVSLRRHEIFLERYCVSARELIRIGDKFTTEAVKNVETRKGVKYIVKMIDKFQMFLEFFLIIVSFYEYDFAYRHRTQFALSLIDKEAFAKNPYKEIKRILDEMNRRENDESVREKYKILDKLIWALKIPKVKRLCKSFVAEMDMTKITPDEDDKEWMKISPEFNFF